MTIQWEPTKGNHYQAQNGTDEYGNKYRMSANLETVTCTTPDGYVSGGWTAEEALSGAINERTATQIDKDRLAQLKAWGYEILTQGESDEFKELEALEQVCECDAVPTLQATNLDFEDLCHWYQRAAEVLGHPVTIEKLPDPIRFNRHDFTGEIGTIRPTNANTFTIDDIDDEWTVSDINGIIKISDGEEQVYRGFWDYGKAYFSACGCEREDADPRIAFAQVLHNI